jgi:hypothetical protein
MRHFLQIEALALPVLALPESVDKASVEADLVLAPSAEKTLSPGCGRARPRTVLMPAVTGTAQRKHRMTPGTDTNPQLDHVTPTAPAFVDFAGGPCDTNAMGRLDPLLVGPLDSLES